MLESGEGKVEVEHLRQGNRICKDRGTDKGGFHPFFIGLKGFLGIMAEVLTSPGSGPSSQLVSLLEGNMRPLGNVT